MKRRPLVPNDDLITIREDSREFVMNDKGWWLQALDKAQELGVTPEDTILMIATTSIQLWEVHRRGFNVDESKSRREPKP